MKMLVFGSRGYLGRHFLDFYRDAVAVDVDIADPAAVVDALDRENPDVVINAAGKTGRPNVDWCEDHKPETIRANVQGPLVLLDACLARNIYLVHLGSGCIYEGGNQGRGFTEEDPPNFFGSFYSRTKAWSEMMLREFPVLILRLRMPFDASREERNLLIKLSKYSKVLDVENSLTFLPDLLAAADMLIKKRATGIYNVVNPGAISPYRIMELYREIVNPNHTFERLKLEGLGDVVRAGRSNCILTTKKLEGEGIVLPPVEQRVREALEALKQ